VNRQADGRIAIGATTKSGRTSGSVLTKLAKLAEAYGSHRVRTTAQQGLVMLDLPPGAEDDVIAELDELGLAGRPSTFQRGTIACTGIEFCKLALVETKGRAEIIREELERRLPDFDTPITINVNGCPNACARFQVADIGFKGVVAKVRQPDGSFVDADAFQVHLGGQLGAEASFGRKFRGLKVTAAEAPDYVERILTGYLQRRTENESFASYVSRAEEAWLL
jgi:sulfite reductase (ferredoxin)